ncbi:MAG: aminoglycoside 6'-N-acetyltransferase [Acutalibacteraceae bacterium]
MIEKATLRDMESVARLAAKMWDGSSVDELMAEFQDMLHSDDSAVFVYKVGSSVVGFAQCGLRCDYVEGTGSSPVGYLEGIFVEENFRGKGYAKALLRQCELWAKARGCSEFVSDCELGNDDSFRFHLKCGFVEAGRIICFTKKL